MAPYTITINNKSQSSSSYGIYAEPPGVTPAVTTTTRIISRVIGVASGQGQATFILSKQLIATCGIYDISSDVSDPPDPKKKPVGTGTEVVDQRYVDLGSKELDGTPVPGSFLEIDCSSGTPSFSRASTHSSAGVGAFVVKTKPDFTLQQAASNKFFIGFSCSVRQDIGLYVTFVPNPAQTYLIMPSNKFYVTIGSFNVRDIVKKPLKTSSDTVLVDFDELATDRVSLVHDAYNNLTIQASPPLSSFAVTMMMSATSWEGEDSVDIPHQTTEIANRLITVKGEEDMTDESNTAPGTPTPQSSVV
ncbi:hypothetical protein F53441_3596 [Fusarium austroafricanum]|uniref:Uncharacterized protein n=1 Tax=Fusarium austroafricanum TaxID=2364996 RepID=A0A8H4KPC9_9HYPO|nr:hypothetical protein F53441_3596 [Fusarium austroafricanum]